MQRQRMKKRSVRFSRLAVHILYMANPIDPDLNLDPLSLDEMYAQQLAREFDLEDQLARQHQQHLLQAQAAQTLAATNQASNHLPLQPLPNTALIKLPRNPEIRIGELMRSMQSTNIDDQFKAMEMSVKVLASTIDPPAARAQEMIDAGMLTLCCKFLDSKDPDLSFQALTLWTSILETNLNFPQDQIEAALPHLLGLLKSPLDFVVNKAAQACCQISTISVKFRQTLLKENKILATLLPLVKVKITENLDLTRSIASLTRKLCLTEEEGQEDLSETISECLPMLERLIMVDDPIIMRDACWALKTLIGIPDHSCGADLSERDAFVRREAAIKTGLIPRVVDLLESNDLSIVEPCSLLLCAIASGTKSQFEFLVSAKFLPSLTKTLHFAQQRKSIALFNTALLSLLEISNRMDAREIPDIISDLFTANMIPTLVDALKVQEPELSQMALGFFVFGLGKFNQDELLKNAVKPEFTDCICYLIFQDDYDLTVGPLISLQYLFQISIEFPAQHELIIENLKLREVDKRICALQTIGPASNMQIANTIISENYFIPHLRLTQSQSPEESDMSEENEDDTELEVA